MLNPVHTDLTFEFVPLPKDKFPETHRLIRISKLEDEIPRVDSFRAIILLHARQEIPFVGCTEETFAFPVVRALNELVQNLPQFAGAAFVSVNKDKLTYIYSVHRQEHRVEGWD